VLHPIAAALEQFHHAAEKRGNQSLALLCVRPAILVLGALSRPCRAPARGHGDGCHEFLCVSVRWFGEPVIGHFMDGHPTSVVFLVVSICAAASAAVAMFIRR
jgi:hypothetical protein